ncbi:MAG TPA: cell wall-binding repeat-containing protein, partial [Thermoleophilaceae bacterium]|nr:cell wall-binding repeat-containing protein [Thermoleophilaceae bacterium]
MSRVTALAAGALASAVVLAGCGLGDEESEGATPQLILESAGESARPGEAAPPTFPSTATSNTIRVAGRDAVEDAAGVVSAIYPATGESDRPQAVTLVDERDWQGGVAAAVLGSGELGTPILLTRDDDIPAVTAGTLARLDPGGAVLADRAQVIRIGERVPEPDDYRATVVEGGDPFETAAAIDELHAEAEGERSGNVMIASGEDPGFAMPGAAWAARSGDPVLFTEADELPEPTRQALEEHEEPNIFVLGPESVISAEVEEELGELGGRVRRIKGETPVEHAVEFARYRTGDFGWGLVTPGQNFTIASTTRPLDAAAATPLATNGVFAPLLLTDQVEQLPDRLRGYLLDVQPGFEENPNQGVFNRAWILGNQDAVSLSFQARIDELLELIPVDTGSGDEDGGGDEAPDADGLRIDPGPIEP